VKIVIEYGGGPASMTNIYFDDQAIKSKAAVEFYFDAENDNQPMLTTFDIETRKATHYVLSSMSLQAHVEEGTN
jgi:hypothetical protein